MIDWGDGTYENTAATLVDAAETGIQALAITGGERILDLGCGTGNAAIAAARRGAKVMAIDPAARLVEVTADRATEAGLDVDARVGDAGSIPAPNASFDGLISIFAVIFAPDPQKAADEMVRVVRPGGRIVITTWLPYGPIAEAGKILRGAMAALAPAGAPTPPPPPWGDAALVRAMFESRLCDVEIARGSIEFEAPSAEAWFAEQQANHPVWRFVHHALQSSPEKWDDLRQRSIDVLRVGNLSKDAFRVASGYLIVTAIVGKP